MGPDRCNRTIRKFCNLIQNGFPILIEDNGSYLAERIGTVFNERRKVNVIQIRIIRDV